MIGYYAGPKLKLEARPLSRFAYFVLVPVFTFNIISAAQVQAELAARMIIYIIVVYSSSALLGLIALEYDLLPDFVTTTVLFSTLASIVTLTIVLAVV